ncbi:hypothetical protein CC86DRAFT_467938 [Ophiobolus disseminans]|uniref:Uncharacterized protein n=1 Tax=Ophiobolus disseminans TaxID=1469910 RepID=A0A6A6ZXW1_9PLEO|nr:hypothetical protein CC86DRAFT_467938 [Ophiobolus disseminans]
MLSSRGFLLVDDSLHDSHPCLMVTSDVFRVLCTTLATHRKYTAAARWRDSQFRKIDSRIQATDASKRQNVQVIEELAKGAMQLEAHECDELIESMKIFMDEITRKNEERASLIERRNNMMQNAKDAEQKARERLLPMVQILDSVFGNLGVLPEMDNIDMPPAVPIIRRCVTNEINPPAVVIGEDHSDEETAKTDLVKTLTQG